MIYDGPTSSVRLIAGHETKGSALVGSTLISEASVGSPSLSARSAASL
jgi:hypothetical protein